MFRIDIRNEYRKRLIKAKKFGDQTKKALNLVKFILNILDLNYIS